MKWILPIRETYALLTVIKTGYEINQRKFHCFFRTALETDLKIEREWRGTLQKSLEEEREKVSAVQTDLQKYKHLEKV